MPRQEKSQNDDKKLPLLENTALETVSAKDEFRGQGGSNNGFPRGDSTSGFE